MLEVLIYKYVGTIGYGNTRFLMEEEYFLGNVEKLLQLPEVSNYMIARAFKIPAPLE
jgi:hypothetical protein